MLSKLLQTETSHSFGCLSVISRGSWIRSCLWRSLALMVSSVRGMNANPRRARLVLGWVPSLYVGLTSQLGQLSRASVRRRLIEYQHRLE